MNQTEIRALLATALECSIYLAPGDPGLTHEELVEIGARMSLRQGEIMDALRFSNHEVSRGGRLQLEQQGLHWLPHFILRADIDYRNVAAFDFVHQQVNEEVKSVGGRAARLERRVIVERGVAAGIPARDLEAALTILVLGECLVDSGGLIGSKHGLVYEPLPSEQLRKATGAPRARPELRNVYTIVQDVIERRTDGRPRQAEPLDAFADSLDQLGYGKFRTWWVQLVGELKRADTNSSPLCAVVLSAALVEGVLSFIVKHAQHRGLGVFGSKSFSDDPRNWQINKLVASACSGNESAVLDTSARNLVEQLIRDRQRIHAGRMLSEFPNGLPDLKPEQARLAKHTAELVVRQVLAWLARFP